MDLPLALQFHFVDVLLGQRVLHLPEAIVVQFCRVDVAADQLRRVRLAQPERRRRRRGWSGPSYRRERRCSCTSNPPDSPRQLTPGGCRLTRLAAELPAGARAVTPPHPADHGQLDGENEQRRPHHRADRRWDDLWLDVEGVPERETSPVATLAREPVPDREGNRQELAGRERRARRCAKGPLEDDRPFSLVVARDTGEIARVVGSDVRASLAGELQGSGAGQIEEPEIHRVLGVAEDEVRLAGARRHLRWNLDRDGVGELGWLVGWRRGLGKRVRCGLRGTCRRLRLPGRGGDFRIAKDALRRPGCASRLCFLLLRRHGKRRPVRSRFLRAHVVPSNEEGNRLGIVDGLNGDGGRGRMERASGLHDLPDDGKAGDTSGGEARGPLRQIDRILNVLGDDEVGIARPVAPRERDDEVGDRPSLLGLEGIEERRHGRAVEPRAHRPEDILAGRAAPEGPTLREVRRAYRMAPVVLQGWSRRSVAPTERAVALYAAGLLVELLSELDGLFRGSRRARERHRLGDESRRSRSRGRTS